MKLQACCVQLHLLSRHSREGGNPFGRNAASFASYDCARQKWIPAFAGMTAREAMFGANS
jgi:hypothetical protein